MRTDRLLLREWRDTDLEPFAAMNADPQVMEHFPATLTREESDSLVGRIGDWFTRDGYGLWAVEVVGTDPFIGFVGLMRPDFEAPFTPAVEIGWRLKASAWGRGYASEAAREVLRFAFEEAGVAEVISMTTVTNERSRAVMARIGMTRDPADDFEHPRVTDPEYLQHVLYRASAPGGGD